MSDYYKKDPAMLSLFWGRIGSAIVGIAGFVLGMVGYTMTPEDQQSVNVLIGGIFSGVAGLYALISKVRESRKKE